jgi:hypothetical protein
MNFIGVNNINAGNVIFASGAAATSIIYYNFQPNNFPNLLSWYSSDYGVYNAPGVLATDGQTVRIWQNKINNGINLEQAGAIQPTYSNGAVKFEVSSMSGINPFPLNAPLTYYVSTQTSLTGGLFSTQRSLYSEIGSIIKHTPGTTFKIYRFGINTGSFIGGRASNLDSLSTLKMPDGKNIIYASFSGAPLSDGLVTVGNNNLFETFVQTFGTNVSNIFVVGSDSASSASLQLKGSINEILIFTGLHTQAEKNQIITYLAGKWGVNL